MKGSRQWYAAYRRARYLTGCNQLLIDSNLNHAPDHTREKSPGPLAFISLWTKDTKGCDPRKFKQSTGLQTLHLIATSTGFLTTAGCHGFREIASVPGGRQWSSYISSTVSPSSSCLHSGYLSNSYPSEEFHPGRSLTSFEFPGVLQSSSTYNEVAPDYDFREGLPFGETPC